MATHLVLVVTHPVIGREDEYNRWYNEQHMRDVVSTEGFVAATRFRVVRELGASPLAGGYAAIYEMETNDPFASMAALHAAAQAGRMPVSDASDLSKTSITLLEPIASYRPGK